jgi:hypothetical protein
LIAMAKVRIEKNGVPYLVIEFTGEEAADIAAALTAIGKPPTPARPPTPPPTPSPNGPDTTTPRDTPEEH